MRARRLSGPPSPVVAFRMNRLGWSGWNPSGAYLATKSSAAPGTCHGCLYVGGGGPLVTCVGSGGGAAPIMSGELHGAAPPGHGGVRDEVPAPAHGDGDLEDVAPGGGREGTEV